MKTPARPEPIARIRPRKRFALRIDTGVASTAITVSRALRTTSQMLIPSTPRR